MLGFNVVTPPKSIGQYCPSFRETEKTSLCDCCEGARRPLANAGSRLTTAWLPSKYLSKDNVASFSWEVDIVENISSITNTRPMQGKAGLGGRANIVNVISGHLNL